MRLPDFVQERVLEAADSIGRLVPELLARSLETRRAVEAGSPITVRRLERLVEDAAPHLADDIRRELAETLQQARQVAEGKPGSRGRGNSVRVVAYLTDAENEALAAFLGDPPAQGAISGTVRAGLAAVVPGWPGAE